MKVLYIHGLHSNPNPKKLDIIKDLGVEVVSPFIDYEQEKEGVYNRIKDIALEADIDLIIGSSLGGFIGYWLSRDIGKPALLFNPALYFESMKTYIPKLKEAHQTAIYICLGEKDTQVIPTEVRQYLEAQKEAHNNVKIINASWLAHGIDLKTFKSISTWFLSEEDVKIIRP